jgi:iron complex transport system substrate-binding protein
MHPPRRGFVRVLTATLAGGLLLGLNACGGSDESTDDTGGGQADTRTITDTMLGDVTDVPAHPERVVALWRTGGMLAELGVVPVGALDSEFLAEELGAEAYAPVADVPVVGTTDGVDIESVIALEPDLIIGMDNGGLTIDYDELSEVAPTVILDIAEPTDVWDNYPRVADLVGRQTDFDERNDQLTADLEAIAEEHGDVVGAASATSFGAVEGTIFVDTSKSLAYRRLELAGFGYNPVYTDDPERYVTELAMENLPDLADQDILFYDADIDGSPTEGTDAVLAAESFTRLPAAVAGHVYPLTSGTIYTFAAAQLQVADLQAAAEDFASAP